MQQGVDVVVAQALARGAQLGHEVAAPRRRVDGAEDAERQRPGAQHAQAGEGEGQRRVLAAGVVDDQAVGADLVDARDAQRPVVVADDAELVVEAEADRLAVDELDAVDGRGVLVGEVVEGAVVEDRAVLEDLDEGGAAVLGRRAQDLDEPLLVAVDGARDEGRAGAERQRQRVERRIDRAARASTW